ncbi:hypothetical protein BY996DRAFT_4649408 [Phakopsora pachyrhizi]|nr:hypothetical protein BY996DRAFT_4649408 [Phakopsora pachyrhizi]
MNRIEALRSTVNIDPKTHKSFSINKFNHSNQTQESQLQPTTTSNIDSTSSSLPQSNNSDQDWNIIDRLRLWRDDARAQHLYQTAAFWGEKVYSLTSDPNDAFWLAQVYFLTGQFFRAEKILTGVKKLSIVTTSSECNHQPIVEQNLGSMPILPRQPTQTVEQQIQSDSSDSIRMTDYSTACRYLAAQCMIRQGKWDEALEMVGEENPFRINNLQPTNSTTNNHHNSDPNNSSGSNCSRNNYLKKESNRAAIDGGIKFESSMCYLRGLIHLQNKSLDRAKESFLESLALDVKCYESFEALVGGNMLEPEEEWEFVQSLGYHHQTPEDQMFIKSLYTVRLKKFNHKEQVFESFKILKDQFNLNDDPDGSFGLADWLFTNYRFQDCYRITSRILALHDYHQPTLPLHLSCMAMIPNLLPSLFLISHQLIERDSNSAISWYGAGLWYFSQKRYEESRRFFSKSALLDSRFCPSWFAFGHALAYEGEHDQAITAYSTASHNFQGSHLPLLFIGMQHIQLANLNLGLDYLNSAHQICKFDPLVLHEKGVVLYYQEKWIEAIEMFEESLKLSNLSQTDPKIWSPTYLNLAHCYRRLKRYKESLESALKAKKLQPRSSIVLTTIGMAHHGLNNNDEAIRFYHESLAVLPADPTTTSLLKFSLELETSNFSNSNDDPPATTIGQDLKDLLPSSSSKGFQTLRRERERTPEVDRRLMSKLPGRALKEWEGDIERFEDEVEECGLRFGKAQNDEGGRRSYGDCEMVEG